MYDENLRRRSKKVGIAQIQFIHPFEERVKRRFDSGVALTSVILTGTAGDGKTYLCGKLWEGLGGDAASWGGVSPYLSLQLREVSVGGCIASKTLHVLRDLSAWVPLQGSAWPPEKLELMHRFCSSLYDPEATDVFLIAGNDGQLGETLRRLPPDEYSLRAKDAVEEMLVNDLERLSGVQLSLFNLSRGSSAELYDLALDALLSHEGWAQCREEASHPDHLFGERCPIRHNLELLAQPLVRKRLRSLLELCDLNGLHVPVRQLLILLTNAVLGHPKAKDHLMAASDIPRICDNGSRHLASLYRNIFGSNLPESRRNGAAIFEYLRRFQIGAETTNRIDNILIFGEAHERLQEVFDQLVGADDFYGADPAYAAARRGYIEGAEESQENGALFLEMLVTQRQALFFKIPDEQARELHLWDLTVFRYGGEYLDLVLPPLREGRGVRRGILGRLVRGLNRIFTGMLVSSDTELYLASSASLSQSRVSRFLDEQISVAPKHTGERVELIFESRYPVLRVCLAEGFEASFVMTLTRFEYLSRVAEGAMPSSFSKECFEDVMSFKSRLMRELQSRNSGALRSGEVTFTTLEIDASGRAKNHLIAVPL